MGAISSVAYFLKYKPGTSNFHEVNGCIQFWTTTESPFYPGSLNIYGHQYRLLLKFSLLVSLALFSSNRFNYL